jgi:hypothetical protein
LTAAADKGLRGPRTAGASPELHDPPARDRVHLAEARRRSRPAAGSRTVDRWRPMSHNRVNHARRALRVMAKQYRDAVGPWRAYLPVLDR